MSLNNSASGQNTNSNSSNPRPGRNPFPTSGALVRRPTVTNPSNPTSNGTDPYTSSYNNNFNRNESRYSTGRISAEPDDSVYSDQEEEEEVPRPPPLRTGREYNGGRPAQPGRSQTDPPPRGFHQSFRSQRRSGYERGYDGRGYDNSRRYRRESPPGNGRGSARVFVNIGGVDFDTGPGREGERFERGYTFRTGGGDARDGRDGRERMFVNMDQMPGMSMGGPSLFGGGERRPGFGLFGGSGGILRGPGVNLPFGL